jgi:hypothetical protein
MLERNIAESALHACTPHHLTACRGAQRAPAAHHERWPLRHSGSGLLAAVIGVTGLAFEARIAADRYTQAICSGDGSTFAECLASAIAAGVTAIVAHPEAKRSLQATTRALAVDNESHVVASVTAARGHPMAAVRVIMDPAARRLPAAALAALRANGTIDLTALIRATVRLPPTAWPWLGATFLASMYAEPECRDSGLRFERARPRAFMMHSVANLFGKCDRDRHTLTLTTSMRRWSGSYHRS